MSVFGDGFNTTVITREGRRVRIEGYIDGELVYNATHSTSGIAHAIGKDDQ
ncbi:hypothetical protein [Rhodococcus sp. IEGM 1318]|uniref:hypothetical protein n=1 Tax=Rhodococcus sp. IEGM 1318 TaxID=3082226 RepID=UPI0029550970|nr:hypothetical protein [Rhodococcus sp. IEGM 1318]MDV8005015.1 hypothetical protein [Rhodococcus sp. IEGM 1318]